MRISNQEIQLQKQRILESSKFVSSERLSRFLEYVVDQYISGKAENIKAYNIALEVLGRDANFDPQSDPIVRVYAGRLRQALKEYYYNAASEDQIRIEIPKGTYRPNFTQIRKPTKSNKALRSFKPDESLRSFKGAKVILVLLVLVLVSVFVVEVSKYNDSRISVVEDDLGRTTIAIYPFENKGQQTDKDFFALRLVEQTEIALNQFSIVLLSNNVLTTNTLAGYSMYGTVEQVENEVKVLVRLIDNDSGVLAFSKEYKESLSTNAASYLEEVFANKIAIDLADEFGELQNFRLQQVQNSNQKVLLPHEAVLCFYDYLTHMNKMDNRRLISELENTAKNFDNYAPLWASIACLYMDKYKHFEGDIADLNKAKNAIEKAEKINPRSWDVQNNIAQMALLENNYEKFYTAIDKQMELNPNSTMIGQIGLWLCLIEDIDRGIPLIEESKSKNPYYPRFFNFGNALYYMENGDFEKAYEEANKVRMPQLYWDPVFRAGLLGKMNRIEEAQIVLNELLELRPNFPVNGQKNMALALYSEKYRSILVDGLNNAGLRFH